MENNYVGDSSFTQRHFQQNEHLMSPKRAKQKMDFEHTNPRTKLIFLNGLAYALVCATAIKIFMVIFSSPILGYANNYDFLRQSSCVGLWQSYPDKPKTAAHIEAPVNSLVFDGMKDRSLCMKSVDNFFPYLATTFHDIGEKVDFREVSFWKAAFIIICVAILIFYTDNPASKIAISMAFLLVFGDLASLLYFNTFYLEFSVISGCFISLSAVILLIAIPSEPKKHLIAFTIFSLAWLAFSKQQYLPLASFLSLVLAVIVLCRWRARKTSLIFLLISLFFPIAYGLLNRDDMGHMKGVNYANKTDTFLWAVLPEAKDKESALAILGLPNSCLSGIGKSWYSLNVQQSHPCPEVEKLSRIRLIRLFITDPSTFIQPMYKAVLGTRPLYPNYLGHIEIPADLNSPKYIFFKRTSLTTWLAGLPPDIYSLASLVSMISGLGFAFVLVTMNKSNKYNNEFNRLILAMVGLGGLTTLYAIASSVFGDGYAEMQKHAVAFMIGIAFQISGVALFLASLSAYMSRLPFQAGATARKTLR